MRGRAGRAKGWEEMRPRTKRDGEVCEHLVAGRVVAKVVVTGDGCSDAGRRSDLGVGLIESRDDLPRTSILGGGGKW